MLFLLNLEVYYSIHKAPPPQLASIPSQLNSVHIWQFSSSLYFVVVITHYYYYYCHHIIYENDHVT
jgi:hypothetical protein